MKEEKVLNESQERSINDVKRRARRHQEKREYFKSEPRSVHIAGSADTSTLKPSEASESSPKAKHAKKKSADLSKSLDKAKESLTAAFAGLNAKVKKAVSGKPKKETVRKTKSEQPKTSKRSETMEKEKIRKTNTLESEAPVRKRNVRKEKLSPSSSRY